MIWKPRRGDRAAPSGRAVAKGLAVLVAIVLIAVFVLLRKTGLQGDEYTYFAGARMLGRALSGRETVSAAALADALIGRGWFMPGMNVLGAPLFMLVENPSLTLARCWAALVNFCLLAMVIRLTGTILGRAAALAVLAGTGLMVLWQVAAFAFLPDLPGGLLATAGVVLAYGIARDLVGAARPPWRRLAALQLVLAAAIYMRGPLLLLAGAIAAALIGLALIAPVADRWRQVGRLALASLITPALLLPWSVTVSRHFDSPVLTTTNFPLVIANGFGNPARTCFGPCTLPGPDIVPSWQFAEDLGHRTRENPLQVQRRMMTASLEGLGPRGYLRQVRAHLGAFLFAPQGWLHALEPRLYGVPQGIRPVLVRAATLQTLVLYVPLLLALFAANLLVVRRDRQLQLQSLAIKLASLCILAQPFFHKSSARYWGELTPFAALALVLLARVAMMRKGAHAGAGQGGRLALWLTGLQAVWAVFFAALSLVIALA